MGETKSTNINGQHRLLDLLAAFFRPYDCHFSVPIASSVRQSVRLANFGSQLIQQLKTKVRRIGGEIYMKPLYRRVNTMVSCIFFLELLSFMSTYPNVVFFSSGISGCESYMALGLRNRKTPVLNAARAASRWVCCGEVVALAAPKRASDPLGGSQPWRATTVVCRQKKDSPLHPYERLGYIWLLYNYIWF